MMQAITLLPICLTLFDGGEGGTGAGADGAQTGAPDAGVQTGAAETSQEAAPDAGEQTEDPKARMERYKASREEFKDLYAKDTEKMLKERFKAMRGLEQQLDAVNPVLGMLFSKYGVTEGDMDALEAAISEDSAFWADAAEDAGMSVEQYKEFTRMERELNALKAQQNREIGEQRVNAQLQQWYMEGEALKELYPKFDLETESQNPDFVGLLRSGIPVQTAFEVVHMEEIKAGVAQYTAKAAQKQITNNIKARGARPAEAGASSQGAVTSKIDVSKLDKKGRAALMERAARGEIIEF